MRRPTLAAALTFALAQPVEAAAQELPAAVAGFAAEQAQACTALGGTPTIGPAFATAVDLNGDAALDYIVDLAGIECANAWSAFCGAAGCPVSVWIAAPGGHRREWSDDAQGWRIEGEEGEVTLVVDQQGGACQGSAAADETCSQRLAFDPLEPAASEPAAAVETAEAAPAARAAPPEALEARGAAGWTLREVPGGTPVAVSDGPGAIATVAVFCLAGQPWLAARLGEPPAAETVELAFAFAEQTVSSAARREDSAGGALIVELADRPLAGLLAGRDSSALISIDGAEEGVLSLSGSTRAVRGALASCMAQ